MVLNEEKIEMRLKDLCEIGILRKREGEKIGFTEDFAMKSVKYTNMVSEKFGERYNSLPFDQQLKLIVEFAMRTYFLSDSFLSESDIPEKEKMHLKELGEEGVLKKVDEKTLEEYIDIVYEISIDAAIMAEGEKKVQAYIW